MISMQGAILSRGFQYGVKHILSPASSSLSDILLSTLQIPPTQCAELLHLGSVYLHGQRIFTDQQIVVGDYLRVHTAPRRFPKNTYNWTERVLFQNDDFVLINKPAALPVHPTVDNWRENLQNYLATHLQQELFVTHRLDTPTSGLIVLAKNKNFLKEFNRLLVEQQVHKIYRARVRGAEIAPGLYTHYMEPSPRAPKTVVAKPRDDWQECVLRVLDVHCEGEEQVLRIELLTGRTHQIRAQVAALGAPICGDVMYGAEKKYEDERIDLEAVELRFLGWEFVLR